MKRNVVNARKDKAVTAAKKARKIGSVRQQLPYMTTNAFAAFVSFAQQNDISELPSSRRAIIRNRDAFLGDTPCGPMLVAVALVGTPQFANVDVYMVNPFEILYAAYRSWGNMYRAIQRQLGIHASSPESKWRIVLYSDEIVLEMF